MYLKSIELSGFKSFGKKTALEFGSRISSIVGPNGSGKCVTGDTLLKRETPRGYEDVRIDAVQVGDRIASMEEGAHRVVAAKVNKLLDQGVRQTYRVVTRAGLSIRATDNHPFFTRDGWKKLSDISIGSEIAVANDRSGTAPRIGIFIDDANLYHAARKAKWRIDIEKLQAFFKKHLQPKFTHYHIAVPEAADPTYANAAAYLGFLRELLTVKEKPLKYTLENGNIHKKGDVDLDLALDVVENLSDLDVVIIMSGDSDYLALEKYVASRGKLIVFCSYKRSMAWELRLKHHMFLEDFRSVLERGSQQKNPERELGAVLMQSIIAPALRASRGPETAVDIVFNPVVSIEKTGLERVWDVEIEDTHNFIGNGIVAHNSNVADGFRFVLGEQSMKSMRGKRGEDMIWGGSPALPRMNRAMVRLVFDNSKRLLDIDFSEVILERVVHRDGQNEYLMNGSQVRLKDVIRLLAGANIGGSGYQIISQGEADRILNASPRERREMVEDALGLKLYQHKKAESERKLEETAVNIDKTKSLRRELAPHLKFLHVQVEKIEKAREMKEELAHKLSDYLMREDAWISAESTRLGDDLKDIEEHIRGFEAQLKDVRRAKGNKGGENAGDEMFKHLEELQTQLTEARRKREDIVRELGRAEGALEATNVTVESIVPVPHVREFAREITEAIEEAEHSEDIGVLKNLLSTLRNRIKSFVEGLSSTAPMTNKETQDAVDRLTAALKKAEEEELRLAAETETTRAEMTKAREASFAAEKDEVEVEAKLREAQSKMLAIKSEREHIADQKRHFEEEVREGIAIAGLLMQGWNKGEIPEGALAEDRSEQEKRRRAIERLKIKIEEAGIGGGDAVVKEYRQTQERDMFLAKELEDLEKSAASLHDIIAELEKTIDERFTDGLKHINEALGGFFVKLFGGGGAKLFVEEPRRLRRRGEDAELEEDVVPEEEELYAGLSIDVSLPRKKIRGLEVLSGGERALTSIALIFSMSQVNPPPFLILDETDAALDEANSKRYADMIMELGKKSQLIVITHNRATMAAAGELYGVTMGQDGVSKVLSVKLEEAEKVAK